MTPPQSHNKKAYEKAFSLAIRYLTYQPRTVHETQGYLSKKGVCENIAEEVIQQMQQQKYLDDMGYAQLFIQSKARHKPRSKFALGYALKKKGVRQAIIDMVLEPYDDAELAVRSIKPKFSTWQTFDDEKFKRKVMNYLNYRGFSFEISHSTLDHFFKLKQQLGER